MEQKKRILLVSSSFFPEISPRSFRATELAKEFYRRGHSVTVISKYRDHDYTDFLSEFPVNLKMWPKSNIPRFLDNKSRLFSRFSKIVSRILSIVFEYPAIQEMFQVSKMLKVETGYDLLISFAVPFPVHWGVARTKSDRYPVAKTWVADCGDPYMFTRLDRFRKPFYFKYQELRFCRKCNYITVPFDAMRNQFYPEFISKTEVIPQGFDFKEITLYEGKFSNNKPVFIFAGSVIPGKRDLTLLLDFLSSYTNDFLFIVYTNQKDWFDAYKSRLGENLVIKDYIDRLSLIFEMSKVDFLVNVDTIHDAQSNIEAVPSKLIDYALSGRPILNIHSANLDKELVLEFLKKDYSGQRQIVKENYDINTVSTQFLELIK